MADHAEARKDQDVNFGMAEEPEQMLEQDRIAAAGRVEEARAEMAVGQQHRDRARENRQRQQQQERRDRIDHTNSGILCIVMPGARMLKIVVMKLMAPRIDDAPAM